MDDNAECAARPSSFRAQRRSVRWLHAHTRNRLGRNGKKGEAEARWLPCRILKVRREQSSLPSLLSFHGPCCCFIAGGACDDFLKLRERRVEFCLQQRPPRIQDPVILALHVIERLAAQAKRLTQEPLRAVTLDGVADGFARGRDTEAMMRQIVAEHKGRKVSPVVASPRSVNALKLAGVA